MATTTTLTAPRLHDVVDEDPVFLQALLDSYMEQAAGILASPPAQQQGGSKLNQTPPASADFIQKLPILELYPQDLVDPVNRECCICLDDNRVGDLAIRLPQCCHVFHKECIVDWLQRKCTCPVCRYEYPTDDAAFEVERLQRQSQDNNKNNNKPRYTRSDLYQMDPARLVALLPDGSSAVDAPLQCAPRDRLVQHVMASGAVDVLNLPEPIVEYHLSTLQKMSVSQLKKVMNKQAGVYASKEVSSSRTDLIQVFVASGRLRLLPEPPEKAPTKSTTRSKQCHHCKSRDTDHSMKRGLQLRKALRVWLERRRHRR